MTALQLLIRASAPRTLLLAISSVIGGLAAAACDGMVDTQLAFACLLFAVFGQIASNLFRYYIDDRRGFSPFGDRYTDKDLVSIRRALREGVYISTTLALMMGLTILLMAGIWTLVIAGVIFLLLAPTFLSRRPAAYSAYSLIATFMIYGPIGVFGTDLTQNIYNVTRYIAAPTFNTLLDYWDPIPTVLSSIIFGCMAMIVHITHVATRPLTATPGCTHASITPRTACVWVIVLGFIAGAAGQATPFLMHLRPWEFFLPVPVVGIAINIWMAIGILRQPERLTWERVAFLNMLWVSIAALIIYATFGFDYSAASSLPFLPTRL